MKHFWINLFAMAILASLAFGQADSCNMTLVDEWTTIVDYDWSGIDMVDNFVIAALGEKLMVLELSATGELIPIDSMFFRANQVAHKDSFIYIMQFPPEGPGILVYKIGATGNIDSLNALSCGSVGNTMQVQDTLLYTYFGSGYGVFQIINISNPLSPRIIAQGDFGGPTNPTAFWGEYPYLYNGGYSLVGEIPDMWRCGKFNIMDVSDPDSQYISYSAYSEFGSFYYPSQFLCMTKKDSLLYIGGKNRYIEVYDIETDGTGSNYVCSYGDSTFYDYAVCICKYENYLFTGGFTVKVYDISDPSEIDLGGYYQIGEMAGTTERYYTDICVKDSFIIVMDTRGTDIVRIEVYKYSYVGMENCEYQITPINLDLRISPNPFNAHCSIEVPDGFTANIYDIHGRQIRSLPDGSSTWNAEGQPSGVYLVRALMGDVVVEKHVVLIR